MSVEIFDQVMTSWFGYTGDYTLIAMGILLFFVIAMVLIGVDLRFALLFCLPLAVVFTANGWFTPWFSVLFWIISVALTGFVLWTSIIER